MISCHSEAQTLSKLKKKKSWAHHIYKFAASCFFTVCYSSFIPISLLNIVFQFPRFSSYAQKAFLFVSHSPLPSPTSLLLLLLHFYLPWVPLSLTDGHATHTKLFCQKRCTEGSQENNFFVNEKFQQIISIFHLCIYPTFITFINNSG